MALWTTFQLLPVPSTKGHYSVERTRRMVRVAKSFEGHPALVVEFEHPLGLSSARRLANLSYVPPTPVQVITAAGDSEALRLGVLECLSTDRELGVYFYRIAQTIFVDDPAARSEHGFESAVDALASLFRALHRPPARQIQGVWGELAVLCWSSNVELALSAWHSSPSALHDFAAGTDRLEVKSTVQGLREHTFSQDQLTTATEGTTLIASLMLSESDDGLTVFGLVDKISQRLSSQSAARLEAIVAHCLGSAWREASEARFCLDQARSSLLLFVSDDLPRIPAPLPIGIKHVRFTVDMSTIQPRTLEQGRAYAPLYLTVLPEHGDA
jgi:hypothetical protein